MTGKPVTGLFPSVHAGTVPFLKITIQLQIPLMQRCHPLCNLKTYEKLIVLTNFYSFIPPILLRTSSSLLFCKCPVLDKAFVTYRN